MQFVSLNFVIHLVVAAKLFAIDDFNVPHVVGLCVMVFLMDRRAYSGWTDSLISVMCIRLTTLAGRSIVMVAMLSRCWARVHVRVVLMMSDEVVWEMVLIIITCFALRWSWIIDSLIEMRLIQFQEGRGRNCHTTA